MGDSFLTLYDLYRLRLPAEQITLSGCSTGVNVVAAGDEPIGLMRGLLAAGARCLLLTLWDVNDVSTARFMKVFYNNLGRTSDRSIALRQAMHEVRGENPHPYYWAPLFLSAMSVPSLYRISLIQNDSLYCLSFFPAIGEIRHSLLNR